MTFVIKHTNGNEYIHANNVLVRNFTKKCSKPTQITNLFHPNEYNEIVFNEEMNKKYPKISNEVVYFNKIVIVSDGYDFERKHKLIQKFPKDVAVLAVNKALKKWKIYNPHDLENSRSVNAFVINNPSIRSIDCMPNKESNYYPTCIASTRTNNNFLKKYKGSIFTYKTCPCEKFGHSGYEKYYVDDYRNPICACISIAHQFGANKIMLLSCDDSFKEKRENSFQLKNGLFTYSPILKSLDIINANLYWLTHQEDKEVQVANFSDGPEYAHAVYINDDEEACAFFTD